MKRVVLVLAACSQTEVDPPWLLDHDRVVAVRSDPSAILPGEVARLDALLAHEGGPTTVEQPIGASAASAPGDLFLAVHFNIDHWQVDGPSEERLAIAREMLGLAPGEPVPLEVTLEFAGPLYATKTVYLGGKHLNPMLSFSHGPELAVGSRYVLEAPVPSAWTVRWLTSCGTLEDETTHRAVHVVEEPCEGEVVVVVRDEYAGVAWQVLPVRAD